MSILIETVPFSHNQGYLISVLFVSIHNRKAIKILLQFIYIGDKNQFIINTKKIYISNHFFHRILLSIKLLKIDLFFFQLHNYVPILCLTLMYIYFSNKHVLLSYLNHY